MGSPLGSWISSAPCLVAIVCGDSNCGERSASEFVRSQSYRFVLRVVVITILCFFNLHRVESVLVQQVASKVGAGPGIPVSRFGIGFHYATDPKARDKYERKNHKNHE